MFRSLPMPVRAAIGMVGVVLSTLYWCAQLCAVTLVKLIIPMPAVRLRLSQTLAKIAQNWIGVNNWLMDNTQRVHWEISGLEGLSPRRWYLVLSNHISGLDIPVLQKVFHRNVPFLRFFLKQELIWVPVLGQAWWALDYPFMQRHSPAQLAKNPALRLEDVAATRRACEKFRQVPTAILNYVEGTRFSPAKHAKQNSPYRHLLRPKAGGIAYAISAMGSQFTSLLDVTIHYPDGKADLWDMLSGRVRRIVVHVQERAIPHEFIEGDYSEDEEYRTHFKEWLNEMWEEKDALLERLKQNEPAAVPAAMPA